MSVFQNLYLYIHLYSCWSSRNYLKQIWLQELKKKFAHAFCPQLLQRWMQKIKHASTSNSPTNWLRLSVSILTLKSSVELHKATQRQRPVNYPPPPLSNKMSHTNILATVIALRRTQLMRRRRNRRMKWRAGKKDLQSRDEGDPCFPEGLCQGVMWSKCLHPPSSSRYLPHQGTSIKI